MKHRTADELRTEIARISAAVKTTQSPTLRRDYQKHLEWCQKELKKTERSQKYADTVPG